MILWTFDAYTQFLARQRQLVVHEMASVHQIVDLVRIDLVHEYSTDRIHDDDGDVHNFGEPFGLSSIFFSLWKFLTNCLTARSNMTSSEPPGILAPGTSR